MGRETVIATLARAVCGARPGAESPPPGRHAPGGYPQAGLAPGTKKPRTMPGLLSCWI